MDDKEKTPKPDVKINNQESSENEEKIREMKQELEDFIEEQGIYIRQ